ncbi:hypothetical protein BGZ60DRAFT_526133 [Tricladium varicosporioides]|nr:hypothetical protein BGZ60DRAFT_526133 [Hymenoscyphus varicosporioides]
MRFSPSTLLFTLLSLIALTTARIVGLRTPSQIAPGVPFTLTLLTQNYIQSVYDVSAAFGIAPGMGYPQSLGTDLFSSVYIGPEGSNVLNGLNYTVAISQEFEKGEATLSVSVMSLYGAVYGPTLVGWNVSVVVGDSTSEGMVESRN